MRVQAIVGTAIYIVSVAGCSGELAQRPAINDPTSAAAAEAPFSPPPRYEPDPLLSAAPTKSPDAATAAPPGHPPPREEPKPRATIYTCPMHPEVQRTQAGECPKCGMTLVPVTPEGGGQ